MSKSEQRTALPVLVWEKPQEDGGQEATVQELRTGGESGVHMPVIRVVSSGFGASSSGNSAKRTVSPVNALRCAA